MALTDLSCRMAKPGPKLKKLSDGGGLQLWVQPSGGRLWRLAYRFKGRQKLLSIGPYPVVTLSAAREARLEAKRLLLAGVDPAQKKQDEKNPPTSFQRIAAEYVDKLKREGRSETTLKKVTWILSFANEAFGDQPIKEIDAAMVLAVLQKVEQRGRFETARRMRSTIGGVFRYAMATVRADTDPTIALKGALTTPIVTPRAAITDPVEFGGLMRAIEGYSGQPTTHAALKLAAYLFPRPGELRAAEWCEFDLGNGIWTIPAPRMKMRREHRTPLPRQALKILRDLHAITGARALVFPGLRSPNRPLSETALNGALRRLGYSKHEATAHGFRASAATLLNESGKWHPDAIERQLAHLESNEVRRAYARGEHWQERITMMQWWADYIDQLRDQPPPEKTV